MDLDNAAALDVKRLSRVLGDEGQFDVGKAHALEDRLDARAVFHADRVRSIEDLFWEARRATRADSWRCS